MTTGVWVYGPHPPGQAQNNAAIQETKAHGPPYRFARLGKGYAKQQASPTLARGRPFWATPLRVAKRASKRKLCVHTRRACPFPQEWPQAPPYPAGGVLFAGLRQGSRLGTGFLTAKNAGEIHIHI